MRIYINSNIAIPKYLLPVVELVTFADGKAWEFCDVEKMEWNTYETSLHLFFTLNGRTEEVHLYGMTIADLFAVYPN